MSSITPSPSNEPHSADWSIAGLFQAFARWRLRRRVSPLWTLGVGLIVLLLILPIVAIVTIAFFPSENIWPHVFATVLPAALWDTVMLMVGVGLLTLVVGTSTAWLISMYEFPGRRMLDWLLLIPLAIPTYIIAFCYVEILDYSGSIQSALRGLTGWTNAKDYWFPEIRSLPGAIFVMSAVLYPYVYLTARASFLQQSICVLEVARTLGRTPSGTFWAVALPLSRPALVAGTLLALMECLNDIGAVEYQGVNTLTTSIYSTWLERSNLGGAAQLAAFMLVLIVILFTAERLARRQQRFHQTTDKYRPMPSVQLHGLRRWGATFLCSLPIIIGFVLPVVLLLKFSWAFAGESTSGKYWIAVWNSFSLSAVTALVAVVIGLFLAYAVRVAPNNITKPVSRLAGFGYAIPGTVLAIGLLIPLASLDNWIDAIARDRFGLSTGLLFSGTVFALGFAYVIRFMAVSLGALDAGFSRISPNLDAAARTLGEGTMSSLFRIHIPLLKSTLGAAALLVFVDCMKELPATLLLRPFNFETLATHVYTFASLEQFEEAALSAITIVLLGLLPVVMLHRAMISGRPGTNARR